MAYSLTYRNGRETTVQFVPEPDSKAKGMIGTGRTICAPTDMYDAAIGERIALGRALIDLGAQVELQGITEVQSIDDFYKEIEAHFAENAVKADESDADEPTEETEEADQPEPSIQDQDAPAERHVPEGIARWAAVNGFRLEPLDG